MIYNGVSPPRNNGMYLEQSYEYAQIDRRQNK